MTKAKPLKRHFAKSMFELINAKGKKNAKMIVKERAYEKKILYERMIRYNRKKILDSFKPTTREAFRSLLNDGFCPTEAIQFVEPNGRRFFSLPPSFYGLYRHVACLDNN